MSIQNISNTTQSNELYKIRKQTEQQQVQESQVQPIQADEYDKANPVGEEAEGIYRISHDDSGSLKVDYKPVAKNEAQKPEQKEQSAKSGGSAPVTSGSDDEDEELKKLKEQRDALRQQINRATDEETRQALRVQLQSVELQIAMKSAE